MPRKNSGYGTKAGYPAAKRRMRGKPCQLLLVCDGDVSTEVDHVPPLSRHRHVDGSGCCRLRPACARCQRRQAVLLFNETRAAGGGDVSWVEEVPDVDGFGVDSPVWDVAWLRDLIDEMPASATWPRLMSVPHPRAVGSLGLEFEWWVRTYRSLADEQVVRRREGAPGMELLWWQRLVARRLLEVDADGRLVWMVLLLTLARQLGKSWLLQLLLSWRLHQGPRFGRRQLLLHMSIQMSQVQEVMAPEIAAAQARPDLYDTLDNNNATEIEWLADGSRWVRIVRGTSRHGGAYGRSGVGAGVVDEAWSITPSVVDEGLEPTIVAGEQPWLMLVSTAHRLATALMLDRRAAAVDELDTGESGLLIEWSTPRHFALDSVDGWRLASPHWTPQREELIRNAVRRALSGVASTDPDEPDPVEAVKAQWLNIWPGKLTVTARMELLFTADMWAGAQRDEDPVGPLVFGVEDGDGRGAAAAAAGTTARGLLVVGGYRFGTRAEAYEWVRGGLVAVPGSALVVGSTLVNDPEVAAMPAASVEARTSVQTRSAVSLLRELVASGRAVHDGSADLTKQIGPARVVKAPGGGVSLVNVGQLELVRCAAWVVAEADRQSAMVPTVH